MIDRSKKILLGSGSPRRRQLLQELRYDFRTQTSDVDETPEKGMKGRNIAEYLALKKALAMISHCRENEILLTADTIVWLNDGLMGKPSNTDEAIAMLKSLSNQKHQVFTGICLMNNKSRTIFSIKSDVVFKKLDPNQIREYVETCRPFDKAGSYGAQECLFPGINPCSENEKRFLIENDLENIFEKSLTHKEGKHFPFIDHIEGSYFNVMGLPIAELVEKINLF